ncbi:MULTISPECIES: PaaI family thioesterase [unclassified Luteococcus]|uniref:PaaI family thioesterase n=1 Tax=unclassified Luteococcus TaxID=2639923 RepID=UPI00313CFD65
MGFLENNKVHVGDGPHARVSTADWAANANGGVHGGLIATLVDSTMGEAVREAVDDDATVVTVQMTVTYLNGAEPGDELEARAEVLKTSKALALVSAEVTRVADGRDIAQAQATFAISHKD